MYILKLWGTWYLKCSVRTGWGKRTTYKVNPCSLYHRNFVTHSFILDLYYVHITFILLSYYIHITFILHLYYIYIAFILHLYYTYPSEIHTRTHAIFLSFFSFLFLSSSFSFLYKLLPNANLWLTWKFNHVLIPISQYSLQIYFTKYFPIFKILFLFSLTVRHLKRFY